MPAELFTVEGLEDKILQALFGNTIFGGFTPLIKKFTNQAFGLEGDSLLDAVLYTNMTPTGVYMDQLGTMQQRIASRQLSNLQRASRTQWFEATAKTLMSYEDWEARNKGGTLEQYEEFMQNRAAGIADNGVVNWLLNAVGFDPDGTAAAKSYLTKAGANVARLRRGVGDLGAMAATRAVRNVFTDEQGNLDYDRRDYGYMNMGETSAVIAALTRDIDYFENMPADTKNFADKVKVAADRIKEQAKEYTKALSPLKDVFGSDVPAMIQAVEQASGQRFTQLSSGSVSEISNRLVAGADAGRYTMQQLATVSSQVLGAVEKMDVPIINDITALAQSQTILGITNTGLIPASMSAHRFEQLAADRVMRASNSKGATALAQAYALWRENMELQARSGDQPVKFTNDEDAFEEFQRQYAELREQGMSADTAILEISGAQNIYSLQEAMGSRYYEAAMRRNLGGQMALKEARDSRIQQARRDAAANGNGDAFDEAIRLLDKNANILNDNAAIDKLVETGELSSDARWQLLAIRNSRYGDLGAVITSYQAAVDTEARTQKTARLRQGIDALNIEFADSASGLIGDFIGVGKESTGGLPTKQSLRNILDKSTRLRGADEDVKAAMIGTMAAAAELAGLQGGSDEDKEAYVRRFMSYGAKDGMANASYMDALYRYYDAYDKEGMEEERKRALYDMELARTTNEDLLNGYISDAGNRAALYARLESGELDFEEVGDFIKGEQFYSELLTKATKKDLGLARALESGGLRGRIQAFMGDKGEATGKQLFEMLEGDKGGKQLIEELGADTVKKLINDQTSKSDSPTRTASDLFGMFDKLVDEFSQLGGKLDELLDIYRPKPSNEGQGGTVTPGTQPTG